MSHIYHADVGGKEFTTELTLPIPCDASAFAKGTRAHIDEISEALFDAIKPVKCEGCNTRDATVLLHHPMLFENAEPPRVEDTPQPVCGRATCTQKVTAERQMLLAGMHALSGLDARVGDTIATCENCAKVATPEEPLMQCARCKVVRYCSALCQKAHWAAHKKFCAK